MENQNIAPLSGGKSGVSHNKNTKFILALAALGVIIIVVIVLILVLLPKQNQGESDGQETPVAIDDANVEEEERRVTEDVLNNLVEVKIDGYKKLDEGEAASSDVVAVSIKNISNDKLSVEVMIGAYNEDGDLLETSALYAENAEPGVTQQFYLFPYTSLTLEQLQNSTYKVYKASTYEPSPEVETEEIEESEEDDTVEE